MKLILGFELSSENVDINYRTSILSYIKHLLYTKYQDDFNELFNTPTMKSYTFSVYFPGVIMKDSALIVEEKQMSVSISGLDKALIAKLYNASLAMKHKSYPLKDNKMTLKKVRICNAVKNINKINLIKFLCPLIVRKREDNKDTYLTFNDQDFSKYLNITVDNLITQLGVEINEKNITLTPYRARTTVVKQNDLAFEVSIGVFVLEGSPELIEVLYQTGIGSRRGQGYGMFKIIGG